MSCALDRHRLVSRAFALAIVIQVLLMAVVFCCTLIIKEKASETLAINVAANNLYINFEKISATTTRLFKELSEATTSEPYIRRLQEDLDLEMVEIQNAIGLLSKSANLSITKKEDAATKDILQDVTPNLAAFIQRVEALSTASTYELKLRFPGPSVADLAAARNGKIRASLEELAAITSARQTKIFEFLFVFLYSALALAFLILIASWVWLIKPALKDQRKILVNEAEISRDLALKNAELLESETRARLLYDDAMKGTRARTEFLAVVSHELRTPLNAVIGFSEVMTTELFGKMTPSRYLDYSKDIYESGQHLLGVVDEILEFSRSESGKLDLRDKEWTSCDEVVEKIFRLAEGKASSASVSMNFSDLSDVDISLKIDQRLFVQAMVNLVCNAVKFSEEGSEVTLSVERLATGDIAFVVSDKGIGIDPSDFHRLLQPFEQVESAYGRSSEGLGLGLAIANNIIRAHGGRIEIESALGTGSKFSTILPNERVTYSDHGRNRLQSA